MPGIADPSPRPGDDNALVPVAAIRDTGSDDPDRMRQLEMRVNVAEKSNRALLEEVVRLQSELKSEYA